MKPVYAMPLRAVDHLDVAADGSTVRARVYIDPEHPILRGHFPGMPIYPGVFIVETLCQAMSEAFSSRPGLASVRSLRLTAPLHGADELTLDIKVKPQDGGWSARAVGHRRDGVAVATIWATFGGA
jgi:3-hydroxyacyl-[acyl-carrier-protein] dehydratase